MKHNFVLILKIVFQIPNSYLTMQKPFPTIMTVPTNITETPMGHTEQESLLKFKGKKHLVSLELIQHVFKTIVGLFGDDEVEALSHWIHYREQCNFGDMYDTFATAQSMSTSVKNTIGMV